MRSNSFAVSATARSIGVIIAVMFMLIWATAAYAQSADDQYGSPTESSGPVAHAVNVLPDTGGPLLLVAGGVLVIGGTGVALVRRQVRRQQ